ncbi:hypothetical protein LEN26_016089 [Aphanomyces euteiches]|nr:hypothetical protein LEN26_016089 [Aphanomyces euteiches]KAH9125910.1 hypothetical protein AeMF1_003562 [Aphanomyces euteiches]
MADALRWQTTDYGKLVESLTRAIDRGDGCLADNYAKRCRAYLALNKKDRAMVDAQMCSALDGSARHACGGEVALAYGNLDDAKFYFETGLQQELGVEECHAGLKRLERIHAVRAAFGPTLLETLAKDARTREYLNDSAFVQALHAVQQDYNALDEYLTDSRMETVLQVLLGDEAPTQQGKAATDLFGNDMFVKLANSSESIFFLGDAEFVSKLMTMRKDPKVAASSSSDPRMAIAQSIVESTPPSWEIIERAFDATMVSKLATNPKTVGFLADYTLLQKLLGIQQNPRTFDDAMEDPRVGTALLELLNVEEPQHVETPTQVAIQSLDELTTKLLSDKKTWPLLGTFVLYPDLVASSSHSIFHAVNTKKAHAQLVAKLTHEHKEIDFFDHIHQLEHRETETLLGRIVDCVEWGQVSFYNYDCLALVMERGINNCRDRIKFLKSDSFARYRCIEHILTGLKALHNLRYIHGDVKLENVVYFGDDKGYKLVDFDNAALIGSPMTAHCTEEYCPPEMAHFILGRTKALVVSEKFDVWCAAVLVLKLFSTENTLEEFLDKSILDEIAKPWFSFRASVNATTLSLAKKALLLKCLDIHPEKRGTLQDLMDILPPTASSSGPLSVTKVMTKLDFISNVVTDMDGNIKSIHQDVKLTLQISEETLALTKATLAKVEETKRDLLRGIFESVDVMVPTSFIILPFRGDQEDEIDKIDKTINFFDRIRNVVDKMIESIDDDNPFAAAKLALDDFTQGQPMYFYLVDEVTGEPVISDGYPIQIDTVSPKYTRFMATNLPLFQRGFELVKKVNKVARLFSRLGVPALSDDTLETIEAFMDVPPSSVHKFNVIQDALGEPFNKGIQGARGPALRELENFFQEKDPAKSYGGLWRVMTENGQVVWTQDKAAIDACKAPSRS